MDIVKNGKKVKEPVFHLTFDDGLSEIYHEIVPILKQKNVAATFFINTDFMDNKGLFYRFKASLLVEEIEAKGMLDVSSMQSEEIEQFANSMEIDFNDYAQGVKPYLTTHQIQELIDDGFTIGGHSKNHPLYNSIREEQQVEQTLESVNLLVEKFNLDYKVFSFPFTDDRVGATFYKKVNDELDLTFGTAGIKKDITAKNLQRIPMEENKKGIELIKTQYLYYILKSFVGKNKIRR